MATILVVDDEKDFLALVEARLSSSGFDVVSCQTTESAIREAKAAKDLSVALVDFWIGDQNPLQLLKELVSEKGSIPIIMMSGGGENLSIEMSDALSRLSGAQRFLVKPFSMDELLRTIEEVLR